MEKCRRTRARSAQPLRGFTLVELLVALSLLSLLVLMQVSALRTFGDVQNRAERRLREDEALLAARRLLGATLEAAAAFPVAPPPATAIDFDGRRDELRWLGVLPGRHGAGGLYRLRLWRGDEGNGTLWLEFAPFVPGQAPGAEPERRALLDGVGRLDLKYRDSRAVEDGWRGDWRDQPLLPDAVMISVAGDRLVAPDLVVALRPLGPQGGRGRIDRVELGP